MFHYMRGCVASFPVLCCTITACSTHYPYCCGMRTGNEPRVGTNSTEPLYHVYLCCVQMQARYNEVRASSLRMLKSVSEFGNSSPSTTSSLTTRQHSPRLSVVRAGREKIRSASPKLNSFWNLCQSIVCIPMSHSSLLCTFVCTWTYLGRLHTPCIGQYALQD